MVYATEKKLELPDSVLCNCWAFTKNVYPSLPTTGEILNNLTATGSVAVFHYEKVGLNHYAVVIGESQSHYLIEETNYERCKKGTRWIPKDYASLIGFFPI